MRGELILIHNINKDWMLKSTLFGVLIALAFINVAVAQKSLVVVTSNK